MTREILERIVKLSSIHPDFEPELLRLMNDFEQGTYIKKDESNKNIKEEKSGSIFVTILSVIFAILLLGLLTIIVIYTFFDVPAINSFVDSIQNIASNLTS